MELHDGEAQVHAPTPELGPPPQEEEGMGEKTQPLHFTPLTFQQILPGIVATSQDCLSAGSAGSEVEQFDDVSPIALAIA